MPEIIYFVLGLIVGSFANVCIYRLPREESIIKPASHCPFCQASICWYDNIPLLSFILLRGRCRTCHSRIPFRYPLVEFLSGLLFLLVGHKIGFSPLILFYWYLFILLIIATFTDFAHLIIPDIISLPGIMVGLIASFIFPEMMKVIGQADSLLKSFLGSITGAGTIWLAGVLGKAIFHKEAMGGGDVKLMAMTGAFLGTKLTLLTIFLGAFFGALVGGILILFRLKTRQDYIPFGPYLASGAVISFFAGERLLNWYLGLLG